MKGGCFSAATGLCTFPSWSCTSLPLLATFACLLACWLACLLACSLLLLLLLLSLLLLLLLLLLTLLLLLSVTRQFPRTLLLLLSDAASYPAVIPRLLLRGFCCCLLLLPASAAASSFKSVQNAPKMDPQLSRNSAQLSCNSAELQTILFKRLSCTFRGLSCTPQLTATQSFPTFKKHYKTRATQRNSLQLTGPKNHRKNNAELQPRGHVRSAPPRAPPFVLSPS